MFDIFPTLCALLFMYFTKKIPFAFVLLIHISLSSPLFCRLNYTVLHSVLNRNFYNIIFPLRNFGDILLFIDILQGCKTVLGTVRLFEIKYIKNVYPSENNFSELHFSMAIRCCRCHLSATTITVFIISASL